jgi:hypothetical protein
MTASPSERGAGREALHAAFLSILPRIELHARIYFRHVRCPHRREDYVAEAVGLAWAWFLRLVHGGKDPLTFPSALATFAARAAGSGRRVCGQERARDVLSPVAQARHGFVVRRLSDRDTLGCDPLSDALADSTRTPPDEQCAFRLDFPAWLAILGDRDRRIAETLMLGERTVDAAGRFGLSPARVSQLRRAFRDGWERFWNGTPGAAGRPPS